MNKFFYLLLLFSFSSCTSPPSKETASKSEKRIIETPNHAKDSIPIKAVLEHQMNWDSILNIQYPIHKTLPYGAPILASHEFPEDGFFFKPTNAEDSTLSPHQQELYDAWIYYLDQHPVSVDGFEERFIPKLKNIEVLNLGDDDNEFFPTHSDMFDDPNVLGVFTYRLTNIGPYEVYYYTERNFDHGCTKPLMQNLVKTCCHKNHDFMCNINGMLMLYDRASQNLKLLYVYYVYTGDEAMIFRFFHISKSGKIRVFHGISDYDDSDECSDCISNQVIEKFEINISPDGPIQIEEKNQDEGNY